MTVAAAVVGRYWNISAVTNLQTELRLCKKNLKTKEMTIRDLNARIVILEEELSGSPNSLPGDLLKIYGHNDQVNIGTVSSCLRVPGEYTLQQKLELVISALLKRSFKMGLIELKRIEQRGSRKIAIIDLRETKNFPDAWKGTYFQGSSGGGATTSILTNTFLQRHYTGSWIDGVEFWYEGEPIGEGDWDHISLSGVKYRK